MQIVFYALRIASTLPDTDLHLSATRPDTPSTLHSAPLGTSANLADRESFTNHPVNPILPPAELALRTSRTADSRLLPLNPSGAVGVGYCWSHSPGS